MTSVPSPIATVSGDESRPLRVLYVEDDPYDAKLFCKQLERAGFQLHADIVTRQEEFLKALRSAPYDIVLADYSLPNWSGLAALETLQREGKDIPFILVTGTVGEEVAVDCIKKGATDYVLKDRSGRLSLAVQRALDERAAREEHKKAERTRDLLAAIVESSDDAIVGMTLDGTVASWNRGATVLYGYEIEEMQGKPISLLFAPDSLEEAERAIAMARCGGSVARYETHAARKDGAIIEVAVTMSPIREPSGDLTGASAIVRDITEQKRLQKQFFSAQKMEAIGQLAAGVAHDFNNLLTVINGYCALIQGELREQDPMCTEIREISRAGERATSLTRQLLAFSRQQILQPRVLDLNAIVSDMDRLLRRLIGEDIDLLTVPGPQLWSVKADPGQLEQVVMNLAVNARDAMPNGGKLTVETVNAHVEDRYFGVQPGEYVMLAITDTGTGMDAATQARIFEPFFTTKEQGKGTGLGLATVYGIVRQSGGTILVYSELGHGTTFKIYLPRVQETPATIQPAAPETSPEGSETVLVVEDEDAVRTLLSEVLHRQGYTVLRATNGGEALLVCEQHPGPIHLMITDVIMPSMSGSELAQRLAPLRPGMKVLYMSGYTGSGIVRQGLLAPGTAFLGKPFIPRVLAHKVREILDRSE